MYQHILFPTDGSESSQKLEAHVIALAQNFNSKVTVLHAYEFLETLPVYESGYAYLDELEKYLESQSKEIALNTRQRLEDKHINVQSLIIKGDPGLSIVNTAEEQGCDLIVMGSRQMGVVKRFILGSVSNYVVNHSTCPVLILPATQ